MNVVHVGTEDLVVDVGYECLAGSIAGSRRWCASTACASRAGRKGGPRSGNRPKESCRFRECDTEVSGDCVPRGQWYEVGAREWRLRVATRAARRNELRRLVEDDMVQGPVALNKDEWDDHLTARHAGHRGWHLLCVVGRDRISMILD